ncbi:hypothetical protein LQU92_01505 [Kocuria sp. LUK]|uniref:hypothetical protein n=1 Tax=Kocuria sp. LUK TaxID=2897828 RepID=UPI001E3A11B6|nr:hypothetical protein [Kocuria sp. LUK]MCD1143919.1 hypothetical protein [Kocuria sp. LUK]
MNTRPVAWTFLHQPAAVEQARSRPRTAVVAPDPDTAAVRCTSGATVTIPYDADRACTAQLLSAGRLAPPAGSDPQTYPDAPDGHQVWVEILDDLDACLPDLSHTDPDLRLVSARREGAVAEIEVTDGLHGFIVLAGQGAVAGLTLWRRRYRAPTG